VRFFARPAHRFESAIVEETSSEVAIELIVTAPHGPTRASSRVHVAEIELTRPLGDRRVVDRESGRVIERETQAGGR
jgi:hypothetical protein